MRQTASRARFRNKIDETVNKLLKKYEPRHASARNLFAKLSEKTAKNDLIYANKYRKQNKVILRVSNLPLIFEAESEKKVQQKIKLGRKVKLTPSPSRLFFPTELDLNPERLVKYSNTRMDKLIRLNDSPVMMSYKNLIRNCSQASPSRELLMEKEKEVKNIRKSLKNLTGDPDTEYVLFREKVESKKQNKRFTKQFLGEVLNDLKDLRYIPCFYR